MNAVNLSFKFGHCQELCKNTTSCFFYIWPLSVDLGEIHQLNFVFCPFQMFYVNLTNLSFIFGHFQELCVGSTNLSFILGHFKEFCANSTCSLIFGTFKTLV